MSGLNSLLDNLRRTYAAIGEVQEVAARMPGDIMVLANLGSLKREATDLEALWEEECRQARVEVCRYRLMPENDERYTVAAVTKSLLDFQELFSQIYDALKNGVKKSRQLSSWMLNETAFDFGFSYPGSLGVALMVPSHADLLGGKFDDTVDAFLQVMHVSNEDEVKDLAKSLGPAVVKKAYDWSRVNHSSGYAVDVTWNTVQGTKKGAVVDVAALGKIVEIIGRTSDVERQNIRGPGILVGLDTLKKRFRFVEPDGLDYSGPVTEEFEIQRKWAVNQTYIAHIQVEEITEYATQEIKRTYRLVSLTPVGTQPDKVSDRT
ncbi:hypothetical protein FXB41_22615 [Bradyrhizobium canariense]|uniref:hypothetical protein n=1 Tax=Bradyrhizobium canariense TaxID=255045 RepID=UPI001CA4D6E7|nr:hypothetical protein [Bradyrhizobium canariense]MBW5437445.1 hypothetical protein [Bradyrhizobium canariense]